MVDLLLGLQWGDEGKGKIVDVLTKDYDVIARFQGGNGVVIDPVIFKKELDNLAKFDIDFTKKLLISRKAHLILPTHRLLDAASEASKGKAKIGSTLKGIGPTYMDKTGRNGLRVGDLEFDNWEDKYRELANKHESMIDYHNVDIQYDLQELETEFLAGVAMLKKLNFIDSEQYIFDAMASGKKILAEGAQGSLLDIDFGTYPYVTSSNTTAAGACTGLGVAPNKIGRVLGIFKAYTTRVGSGPFPTELFDADGETMGRVGNEFGATTGRPRRCGWLDLVALKYAVQINGVTELMMMKGDVLSGFKTLKICTAYKYKGKEITHLPYNIESENITPVYKEIAGWDKDLTKMTSASEFPDALNGYIAYLEKELNVPIKIVSVGPDRTQTVHR